MELLPVARDVTNGTEMIQNFAIIAAWVGEKEIACENIATIV
jgi:hypothetical protein